MIAFLFAEHVVLLVEFAEDVESAESAGALVSHFPSVRGSREDILCLADRLGDAVGRRLVEGIFHLRRTGSREDECRQCKQ